MTVDFENPEDLRHLIDFSEPWLDLSVTGVSDDGFIVGVGKKLKLGAQKPVSFDNPLVQPPPTKAGGATHYGPTDPEKCGIWNHDIHAYEHDGVNDYEDHAFMLIPLAIRTDANRDGKIADDGSDTLGSGIPWRFWVNDDSDEGDVADGGSDIPGGSVPHRPRNNEVGHDLVGFPGEPAEFRDKPIVIHGRTDLPDWFPVYIDGKDLLEANDAIPGKPMTLVFSHPEEGDHQQGSLQCDDARAATLSDGFHPLCQRRTTYLGRR